MKANLTPYYQAIAEVVSQNAPTGWRKAWVPAEVNNDNSEYSYHFIDEQGQKSWFHVGNANDDFQVHQSLKALRSAMQQEGGDAWTKCVFTLYPDGRFQLDVEYDR